MNLTEEQKQEIMDYTPDFRILGMIDLEKSTKESDDEKRIVIGEVSNTDRDEQKEIMIQKSLDFSYFDTNGVIKYEHLPKNSPTNIIGFPHERQTNDNRTLIKGALFKGHKMADETWSLLKAIERHNKEFPDYQKTVGWSLEGNYANMKSGHGGLVKGAKIFNVVITPNPILKSTYLQLMAQNNAPIFKSLSATPVHTDLPVKEGGEVIVEDNIDTNIKSTVVGDKDKNKKKNRKKKKEEYVMKSFQTYEEAVAHFVGLNKTQEEAEELAKSLDLSPETSDENTETDNQDIQEVKKGLDVIKGMVSHLLKGGKKKKKEEEEEKTELEEGDEDLELDEDDVEKGLEPEDLEIDATEFLKDMKNDIKEVQDSIENQNSALTKSLEQFCNIIEKFSEKVEALDKSLTIKDNQGKDHSIGEGIHALMKSQSGLGMNVNDLKNYIPVIPENQTPTDKEVSNFAEVHAKLEKGVTDGKIQLTDQVRAENAYRTREFDLVKSTLQKCN